MSDLDDPLAIIAAAHRSIAQSTASLEATTRALQRQTGLVLAGLGLVLLGLGGVLWYTIQQSHDHTALLQSLAVQTEALRRLVQKP